MELDVGDVVKLKSSDQEMTVEEINDGNVIDVVWFNGGGYERDSFDPKMLELVSK